MDMHRRLSNDFQKKYDAVMLAQMRQSDVGQFSAIPYLENRKKILLTISFSPSTDEEKNTFFTRLFLQWAIWHVKVTRTMMMNAKQITLIEVDINGGWLF